MTNSDNKVIVINTQVPYIRCARHGEHQHVIKSTIPNYSGYWCQMCWLESLGKPLEPIYKGCNYE